MSGLFDDDPRADTGVRRQGRPRALLITVTVVVTAFVLLSFLSTFWTERLWFLSLGYGSVFSTMLWTRVGLFLVFGALMTLAIAASMLIAYRARPLFRPQTPDQAGLDRYRDAVVPVRTWLMAGLSLVMGVFAGASAAGQWRTFMLWRNGGAFGTTDPFFDRDIGFYVFDLPWLHFLADYAMTVLVLALIAGAAVHYLFGGIRLQSRRDRLSPAAQIHFSVLLGLFVLVKAGDYWLDRFDLLSQRGSLITGMNYTDEHAVLPAREILVGIAIVCALLFFANIWRRTWLLPAAGLALMLVSSILLTLIWPGLMQKFVVTPSIGEKEASYVTANMAATRAAYGIDDVETQEYSGEASPSPEQYAALAALTASTPVVDPRLVQRTFEQDQQVRAYYSTSDVLDVDRYELGGFDRALVIGVRELNQDGLDESSRNWSNLHTVYTHGNGVIAAYANQRPFDNLAQAPSVRWAEGQESTQRALTELSPDGYETRVYYGEQSPDFSIVGKSDGGEDVERNVAGASGTASTTTYDGVGGVPIGGLWHQLLYSLKFGDPNIMLSERVYDDSRILYDRKPGDMVRKVAPWLTVDSDPYPAVVDGRIVWILDGYTMTDRYPQSQRASFDTMTDDALASDTAFQTLPTDEINYMRQAVKATVDAYDGTVTLYAWDESDPILQAWRSAFPGVVKDKAEIPEALLSHLRYPEDLFKVQRYQYARYHVDAASDFIEGNSQWAVPEDTEVKNTKQPPYRLFVNVPDVADTDDDSTAQTDAADTADASEPGVWSMTSVFVPNGKNNLAAFMTVDSDATDEDGFGRLRVLQLPEGDATSGPGLIRNEFSSDQAVRDEVFKFSTGIKPLYGNLLTFPVGDGMMFVQPLYAARDTSDASPPILKFVMVSYGGKIGIGETLDEAIKSVLGVTDTEPTTPTTPTTPETTGKLSPKVRALLDQASEAYAEADRLQREGDTAGWADALDRARDYVDQALALLDKSGKEG